LAHLNRWAYPLSRQSAQEAKPLSLAKLAQFGFSPSFLYQDKNTSSHSHSLINLILLSIVMPPYY